MRHGTPPSSFEEPRKPSDGERSPGRGTNQLAGFPGVLLLIAALWAVIVVVAAVIMVGTGSTGP